MRNEKWKMTRRSRAEAVTRRQILGLSIETPALSQPPAGSYHPKPDSTGSLSWLLAAGHFESPQECLLGPLEHYFPETARQYNLQSH
jgi:hypothetical protein